MAAYIGNIEKETLKNNYFRKVLFTGKHEQLVVMCLQPGEEIDREVHEHVDQFFRVEEGSLRFILNGKKTRLVNNGEAVIVPAGTFHEVLNGSKTKKAKLYTIYSPPNHPPKTIHKTKKDADKAEEEEHRLK